MRKVMHALVGAIVASLVAAAVSVYAAPPTEADFAACNTDAQAAMKAGTTTPTTKDYARGVSPEGQRSDVDHVGRADQHGVLGSLAYRDGDRGDHGRRVSGDISHVHATEWILRRLGRKREAGLQHQRDTEDRTGIGGNGQRVGGRVPIGTGTAPVPGALDQAALTSIVLGIAACGVGTLTWSMPFAYFASTRAASTPSGSAKLRWNAPYATSRTK